MPLYIYNPYFRSQKVYFKKLHTIDKKRQRSKLKALILNQLGVNCEPNGSEKWFLSPTSQKIADDIQILLGLSDKYNLSYQMNLLPLEDILTDVENIVDKVPEQSRNENRNKTINLITNHFNYLNHNQNKKCLFPFNNVKTLTEFLKKG